MYRLLTYAIRSGADSHRMPNAHVLWYVWVCVCARARVVEIIPSTEESSHSQPARCADMQACACRPNGERIRFGACAERRRLPGCAPVFCRASTLIFLLFSSIDRLPGALCKDNPSCRPSLVYFCLFLSLAYRTLRYLSDSIVRIMLYR